LSLTFLNPQYTVDKDKELPSKRTKKTKCKLIIWERVCNMIWTIILKPNQEWETHLTTQKSCQAAAWYRNQKWAVKCHCQRTRRIMTQLRPKRTIWAIRTKNRYSQLAYTQHIQTQTQMAAQPCRVSKIAFRISKMVKRALKNRSSTPPETSWIWANSYKTLTSDCLEFQWRTLPTTSKIHRWPIKKQVGSPWRKQAHANLHHWNHSCRQLSHWVAEDFTARFMT